SRTRRVDRRGAAQRARRRDEVTPAPLGVLHQTDPRPGTPGPRAARRAEEREDLELPRQAPRPGGGLERRLDVGGTPTVACEDPRPLRGAELQTRARLGARRARALH